MVTTHFTVKDPDGFELFIYKWAPSGQVKPKAAVQVVHGAAEHAARYERFGRFLSEAGYVVYADDHRGHGKTAGTLDKAGIAGEGGWNGMIRDMKQITERICDENPGLPIFMFGHSMGSFMAQQYMQIWGSGLAGVVLSGSTGSMGDTLPMVIAAARHSAETQGRNAPSNEFVQMFGGFNQPFQPVETGFEWLSRDKVEVQKYVDDPWCGFAFSNGMVADMLSAAQEIWTPENEAKIPKRLPVLIVSGAMDPVGGFTQGIDLLARRYQALDLQDLSHKYYEGARHEILNETNRDEVQQDVLNWLNKHLA